MANTPPYLFLVLLKVVYTVADSTAPAANVLTVDATTNDDKIDVNMLSNPPFLYAKASLIATHKPNPANAPNENTKTSSMMLFLLFI